MTEDEWEKIVAYEKARKRVYCEFCKSFRYCRRYCKTEEKAKECKHTQPPKPKVKKEKQTVCPHCKQTFEHKSLTGHMISCKLNPKAEERKKKIAQAKTGTVKNQETKEKISETMKSTLQLKKDEDLKAVKSLQTTKNIKLRFF